MRQLVRKSGGRASAFTLVANFRRQPLIADCQSAVLSYSSSKLPFAGVSASWPMAQVAPVSRHARAKPLGDSIEESQGSSQ
jgi:hypothetical protein